MTTLMTNVRSFLHAGCPSCQPTNSVEALKETQRTEPATGLASSFLHPALDSLWQVRTDHWPGLILSSSSTGLLMASQNRPLAWPHPFFIQHWTPHGKSSDLNLTWLPSVQTSPWCHLTCLLLGSAQLQLHQLVYTAADAKSDCTLFTLMHYIQSSFHSQAALILTRNVGQCPTWWLPCRI